MYSFFQSRSSYAHRDDTKQDHEDLIEHILQLDGNIQAQTRYLQPIA